VSFVVKNGNIDVTVKNENELRVIKDGVHTKWLSKIVSAFGLGSLKKTTETRYNLVSGKKNTCIGTIEYNPLYNKVHSIVKPPYQWVAKDPQQSITHLTSTKMVSEVISSNCIVDVPADKLLNPTSSPLYFVSDL
jgi:hypothetical protein